MRRLLATVALGLALIVIAGCAHNNIQNPIANVASKQPDKVLFDRAMDAMKKGKYDVARITLQTLINTYPDSEYVARAKLSVADSWYAESSAASLQQAELEYLDFQTFFPNMAEAAEAQLKVANIHYKQMEKPDRDYTHAKRAEEAYRQLIQQYPDSKLVPDAKERLREVQEVLAEKEFRVGRFYYLRESWAAAIARLKSLTDSYELYSKADDALMMLGSAYEKEIDAIRAAKFDETAKGRLIADFAKGAAEAYGKIITRYPVAGRADDARARLQALHLPVPTPTPEAIAANKAEEDSRGKLGKVGLLMLNVKRRPDIASAAKVGEPTLVTPEQTGAPDVMVKATRAVMGDGSQAATVEKVGIGPPAANQPTPRSDQPPTSAAVEVVSPSAASPAPAAPARVAAPPVQPDPNAIPDLAATPGATVAPAQPAKPPATSPVTQPGAPGTAPAPIPPVQVNDASRESGDTPSAPAGKGKDSSSNKGKKKNKKKPDNKPEASPAPAPPPGQ